MHAYEWVTSFSVCVGVPVFLCLREGVSQGECLGVNNY